VYFDFARRSCGWRLPFLAIAAIAVCLSGCVTKNIERNTAIDRKSEVAIAPLPPCSVQELRTALAAKESGYYYELHCS